MSYRIRILKLSAAAAMIVAIPALASAQSVSYSTSSPVAITSFDVDQSLSGTSNDEPPQFIASGLALQFINKSNVPVTTVKFLVNDGRFTQSIVDKGTFSPGVQIKHTFAIDGVIDALPNAKCSVTEVDFADGSAWHIDRGDVVSR
jgi:hypothetical protein